MGNWRSIRHRQLEDGSWQQQALQPTEELLKFLSTAPGATWLADVLLGAGELMNMVYIVKYSYACMRAQLLSPACGAGQQQHHSSSSARSAVAS